MNQNDTPVYIVLGATGGIGASLCSRLAHEGAYLLVSARNEDALRTLAKETGGSAHPCDATDFDQVQNVVAQAMQIHGRLDGIANCIGSLLLKPAHLTSVDEFNETVRQNLHTAFFTVKAATRAMIKTGGSIVLCSSAVARTGLVNHEAIAAAKAGILGLAQSAAATYARRNIRVNSVAPGLVQTPMTSRLTDNEASRSQAEAMHGLGRLGEPGDISEVIHWLLDGTRSGWVTGQVIGVDGGLATVRSR